MMALRNSGDYEEQRWAHYTEYVFYREPKYVSSGGAVLGDSPRVSSPARFATEVNVSSV